MRAAARLIKRGLVDLYWTVRGPTIRGPAVPPNPRSVLFVCKGNICRSPFAERIAQRIAVERGLDHIVFGSAGIRVSDPASPPEGALRAAERFGVDLGGHRSRPMSAALAEKWDMIVVMEVWQLSALRKSSLGIHDRLFLLSSLEAATAPRPMGYSAVNIEDPYGGSLERFVACFERIERCIRGLFQDIGCREDLTALSTWTRSDDARIDQRGHACLDVIIVRESG